MWSGARKRFLARHDFYMDQVKIRVLGNFDNMEEEANRVAEEVYDQIGSSYSDGCGDMAAASETAQEHGIEFYMLLSDMKTQTTLEALASLYHQWEKDFRDFMERELSHASNHVIPNVWQSNINELFNLLEAFGWPIRQAQWFQLLNVCRLIVNVFKHGKGPSMDELIQDFPQYLKGPLDNITKASFLTIPEHEDLSITEEEFDHISSAIRQFWVEFPDRLFPPQCS